ncbi:MAG: hypothetical protein ABH823_04055, partial [bacterium]
EAVESDCLEISFPSPEGGWRAWPKTATVTARFVTIDGRPGEVEQEIKVFPPPGSVADKPLIAYDSQSHTKIDNFSDTVVTYTFTGITDNGALLAYTHDPAFPDDPAKMTVRVDNLAAQVAAGIVQVVSENFQVEYNDEGEPVSNSYSVSLRFLRDADSEAGRTLQFTFVGAGEDASRTEERWFPGFNQVEIVQKQANAGASVPIQINRTPSGTSNYRWYVGTGVDADGDGVLDRALIAESATPLPAITHTFANPGLSSPGSANVQVVFDTTYVGLDGEIIVRETTIEQDFRIFGPVMECMPRPSNSGLIRSTTSIPQFSGRAVDYTLINPTNSCGDGLLESDLTIENLPTLLALGLVEVAGPTLTVGEDGIPRYQLSARFKHPAEGDFSGYFDFQQCAGEGIYRNCETQAAWFPSIAPELHILTEQVIAGSDDDVEIDDNYVETNFVPSGGNFRWIINESSVVYGQRLHISDLPLPTSTPWPTLPENVRVRFVFEPWYGDPANDADDIVIPPYSQPAHTIKAYPEPE